MARIAIGDLQGCLDELRDLLQAVRFSADRDQLWFVGDLVNRGPDSLGVLRFVRALGDNARVVLGNHDLHLLAVVYGRSGPKRKDTLSEVLAAPDLDDLCDWLRRQPLAWFDAGSGSMLVHAGMPHLWSVAEALERAAEVEQVLRGPRHREYFEAMYGDVPACWSPALAGMDRLRAITNYFTRMRWIHPDGALEFRHKGELADRPAGHQPWFALRHPAARDVRVLFGHWAALDGMTTGAVAPVLALDTGCVWGRRLSALRLEDGATFSVPAVAA
jgi:bis(5'-nucleosyl)-tetraphosphatase (symmetrical)